MGWSTNLAEELFFIEASIEMFSYMVALAVTLALEFGQGETLSKATSVFLVVIICLFCFAYGRSWGPLGWLVPCELFPLETRSAGRSIVVCLNMIFTAIDSTMLSRVSLPSSIWDFLVICCLGCLHGQLHLRSPARNKASLNRGGDAEWASCSQNWLHVATNNLASWKLVGLFLTDT
ncbi:sugar transport protein 14 [Populus alba x Populus x berolinensis]|nr:sugar transport protein 14 [Populus alba x Populus x berolinensis]